MWALALLSKQMQHGDELLAERRLPVLVGHFSLSLTNLAALDSTSWLALCSSSLFERIWAFSLKIQLQWPFTSRLRYNLWLQRMILTNLLTSWRLSHVLKFIWGQTCSTATKCTGNSTARGCYRKALVLDRSFSCVAQRPRPVALLLCAPLVALHQICCIFYTFTTAPAPPGWEVLI